jgi:hypothetical protein
MKVVPMDRPRKGHQPPYVLGFNSDFAFLIGVQSSERFIQNPSYRPTSSAGCMVVCAQTAIFFSKPVPKNAGTIHFMFGGQTAIQTKIVQSVGGFFHQIKVCQPIGRKDSIQTAF